MDQAKKEKDKESTLHPFCRKLDMWIILAVIAAVLLSAFFLNRSEKGGRALIKVDDRLIKTVYLDQDQIITLDQAPGVVIEVRNGAIGFIRSDCPDQICVQTGFISRQGQVAVCLPNKVVIAIPSASEGPDAVTQIALPFCLKEDCL